MDVLIQLPDSGTLWRHVCGHMRTQGAQGVVEGGCEEPLWQWALAWVFSWWPPRFPGAQSTTPPDPESLDGTLGKQPPSPPAD